MSKLTTNTINLQSILETINNLPDEGNKLPTLTNPGTSDDLLLDKQLIDSNGNIIEGTIPTKTASDLTVNEATVIVPQGYYSTDVNKTVATATQAKPFITLEPGGLITAKVTQTAGYVSAGTKSSTYQLAFQPAKTITPGIASQIAVSSGYYTGGNITITGDSNLVAENIKSGVSIFGVNGTLEGETVVDDVSRAILDKTITEIEDNTLTSIGTYALYNCYGLTTVSFPACTDISTRAFAYCRNLTTADFPSCTDVGASAFANCHSLTTADFPVCVNIDANAFATCRILSSLTLGASSVCTLANSNAFSSTPFAGYRAYFSGTPYIYVPSSLVAAYQSATNWTYFSSRFSSIESLENGSGA